MRKENPEVCARLAKTLKTGPRGRVGFHAWAPGWRGASHAPRAFLGAGEGWWRCTEAAGGVSAAAMGPRQLSAREATGRGLQEEAAWGAGERLVSRRCQSIATNLFYGA